MKKLLWCCILISRISGVLAQEDSTNYSFFTAGHTYGNPMSYGFGLHPPFENYIDTLNNNPKIEMGFLTGDIVYTPNAQFWDSAQTDLNKFTMPIYIAAGNHDIGQEFVNRFGDYYFSFQKNGDLFIVLAPGLNSWNIIGNQLTFLQNTLDSNHNNVKNIFIFLHELIWWSPENKYNHVKINYEPHYPGSTNFESTVKPLLLSYDNNITIYAGDLGATNAVSACMYDKFDNITLIASGMGGRLRDNIIITEVYNDSIHHNLVAINETDPNALGEIYDYSVNSVGFDQMMNEIIVYPNPTDIGQLRLKNNLISDITMQIYNLDGKLIQIEFLKKNSANTIQINNLKSGIYFLRFFNDKNYATKKLIVR